MSAPLRRELFLNQVAQQIVSLEEAETSFRTSSENEQRDILRSLSMMIGQAHPTPEVLERSFAANDRSTARAMLKARSLKDALRNIPQLPHQEMPRTFVVLLRVFKEADEDRRRRTCASGCAHWWHQDLTEPGAHERVCKFLKIV